jgi:tetratricopeptide (TPR) repeat protein
VALATSKLAVMVHTGGNPERAAPLYLRAIELEILSIGPEHPEHASTLSSYGSLCLSQGNAVAAEPIFRNALRIRRGLFPASDSRVLRTQLFLADALAALNRPEEAAEEFERAIDVVKSGAVDPGSAAKVSERAAAFYAQRGRHDRAREVRALAAPKTP